MCFAKRYLAEISVFLYSDGNASPESGFRRSASDFLSVSSVLGSLFLWPDAPPAVTLRAVRRRQRHNGRSTGKGDSSVSSVIVLLWPLAVSCTIVCQSALVQTSHITWQNTMREKLLGIISGLDM